MIAETETTSDLLERWCDSETARETLCRLVNALAGHRLLEIAEQRNLGQAIEAHAPNHPCLRVRQLSPNLYAIEAIQNPPER